MNQVLLDKIEEIYENNLVLLKFYNDISENFFRNGSKILNSDEIMDFIEDVKSNYEIIFNKLEKIKKALD